jgi:hypothetical protein
MATSIKSSDLDFNNIKSRLKTYLQASEEFSDYDFEASGLSNILDVLAYNTHLNGLIANFAINESFLGTAQLRSSVLSHAEVLGYNTRSATAARASVNLSFTISSANRPASVDIPAYTEFTTSVDGINYTFMTLEPYTAFDDGNGVYVFEDTSGNQEISIVEGSLKTKSFLVADADEKQVYVIPDETIDTSTLSVKVYDSPSSLTFSSYSDINKAIRVTQSSQLFSIKEVPNGYYELIFSDGTTLGNRPVAGNKIIAQYLSTSGSSANAADNFTTANSITVDGVDYTIAVSVVSESAGGSAKEGIESIRANAPIAFASQQRMVTAEDYKAQILNNYSAYIKDVVSWGGNDNDPPIYGRVYVSLQFKDDISTAVQRSVKNDIIDNLSANLAIMSIDTVFSDPVFTYLETTTTFNFDPNLSDKTGQSVSADIKNYIESYFSRSLSSFNSAFRRSNLLAEIDDISPAILNSRMSVKIQQRLNLTLGTATNYALNYPVRLADPDDVNYILTSSRGVYNGISCFIRNKLNSTSLELVDIANNVLVDNVGEYVPAAGRVNIVALNLESIVGDTFKISVKPANESTIKPLRNYIISLDRQLSTVSPVTDYQNTVISLT